MTRRLLRSLCAVGAGLLLLSLVLVWSHQLPPAELARFHGAVLFGVAPDPTALQVYAIAGEVLAALAIAIFIAGLWGRRAGRAVALGAVLVAGAFVLHARAHPPTNGLLLATGAGTAARYAPDPATPGPGETVALIGLGLAVIGLAGGVGLDVARA